MVRNEHLADTGDTNEQFSGTFPTFPYKCLHIEVVKQATSSLGNTKNHRGSAHHACTCIHIWLGEREQAPVACPVTTQHQQI